MMLNDSLIYDSLPVHNNLTTTPPAVIPQYILYQVYTLNGILVLLGVFGNLIVCYIISRGKKMESVANLFLVNLAVADLLILVISYPLWILQALLPYGWPFGSSLCKLLFPLSDCFYGVSLGCMMAISIHRYLKIIHSKGRQMKNFHAKVVIIFFYLISILTISVPGYPIMQYSESIDLRNVTLSDNNIEVVASVKKRCWWSYPSPTYKQVHMLSLSIGWYIIPLLLILLTFLRIKCYLQRKMSYHWVRSEANALMKSRAQGIKKALRLLAPVVIAFAVLMLPWNILRMVSLFKELDYSLIHNQIFSLIASTMLVVNSVVNPFIYYITSNDFRLEFRNQFRIILDILKLTSSVSDAGGSGTGGSKSGSNKYSVGSVHNNYSQASDGHSSVCDAHYPNFDEMFSNYKSGDYKKCAAITEEANSESIENRALSDDEKDIELKLDVDMMNEIKEKFYQPEYKETDL